MEAQKGTISTIEKLLIKSGEITSVRIWNGGFYSKAFKDLGNRWKQDKTKGLLALK